MGVGGKVFTWIKDWKKNSITDWVRLGSNQCTVGNGTSQGSVISLLPFIITINDVFSKVPVDVGGPLQPVTTIENQGGQISVGSSACRGE